MNAGDRVLVTVLGDRVEAYVREPWTALGNVLVELRVSVEIDGKRITTVVRSREDVEAIDR